MESKCFSCKNKKVKTSYGYTTCNYSGSECRNFELYDPFKKTNGDNFRAMTDEELAEWLACNCDCTSTCMAMKPCCAKSEKDCVQAWKEWLRQECEK